MAFVAAAEAVPFAKTGGLGKLQAHCRALARLGTKVTLICRRANRESPDLSWSRWQLDVPSPRACRRAATHSTGVRFLLVDQPAYFDRDGLYVDGQGRDFADNCERFAFFCRAALAALATPDEPIDAIHAHDWQTALVPLYFREFHRHQSWAAGATTIFTIHNLAYQGTFPFSQWWTLDGLLFDDIWSLRQFVAQAGLLISIADPVIRLTL